MRTAKEMQYSQFIHYIQHWSIDEKDNGKLTLCARKVPMDMDARI